MALDDHARELDAHAAGVVERQGEERADAAGDRELHVPAVTAQVDAHVGRARGARLVQETTEGLTEPRLVALDDEAARRQRDRDARSLARPHAQLLNESAEVDLLVLQPELAGLQLPERDEVAAEELEVLRALDERLELARGRAAGLPQRAEAAR